ncbi:MAG: cytochrome c oxidase assembly protein [Phycisphaerales bacterium]|nr:cytochrome c oxidase assembly protein [Phycisphaerales bacterium]
MRSDSFLSAWQVNPWLTAWLCLVLAVYFRGFLPRMARGATAFRPWRACCFVGGILALWVAVSSPLETYGGYLLSVHMTQHLVLMMVVPPLVLAGNPGIPLMMGLPAGLRRNWIEPLLASPAVRRAFGRVVHPAVGWVALVVTMWAWHVPALYELALVNSGWHTIEHLCFLLAAFLFWWPVVQPYPTKARFANWMLLAYLLTADIQNTVFSALFCFAESVIYPTYVSTSPAIGVDPLRDQALAGAIMWVPGSVAFLVPVGVICARIFESRSPASVRRRQFRAAAARTSSTPPGGAVALAGSGPRSISLPQLAQGGDSPGGSQARVSTRRPARFDVSSLPVIGPFLRSRTARNTMRVVLLIMALVIVLDGFLGPRNEAMNAAGVIPFTHWRGILVLALLFAGNVFCAVCPFVAPRMAFRRIFRGWEGFRWPRMLRSKWVAVGIVVAWLWAYEALALWASPLATAWIIVGYFAVAFLVDVLFRGASFCKWICPIGQFNFVNSMLSPVEVAARDPEVCASCTTQECIRGSRAVPGCGLDLFIPAKEGSLDCTGCLDCADACPHDNVGVLGRSRVHDLLATGWRSSIGRLSSRSDLAALVMVLVFGAFANAAGMVGPVLAWQDDLALRLGLESRFLPATILVLGLVVVVPAALLFLAASFSRLLGGSDSIEGMGAWRRGVYTLLPIGASMWLVHFGFHLATSAGTGVSVVQRMAGDIGLRALGEPEWIWGCCATPPPWLLPMEMLALDLGLVASIVVAWRMAAQRHSGNRLALSALPWIVLASILFTFGLWLILQPMEMRGTIL